jgi:hypothetical protein
MHRQPTCTRSLILQETGVAHWWSVLAATATYLFAAWYNIWGIYLLV